MNAVDSAQAVQEIYAAFGRGDVPPILAPLSDDAELHHDGPAGVFPWALLYHGKDK